MRTKPAYLLVTFFPSIRERETHIHTFALDLLRSCWYSAGTLGWTNPKQLEAQKSVIKVIAASSKSLSLL